MEKENKGPKADAVARIREFRKKLREETLAKAKEKAKKLDRTKKEKHVALPKNGRRKELDL